MWNVIQSSLRLPWKFLISKERGKGRGEAKGTVLSFLRETERYNTTNSFDGTFYASTLHVCKSNIKSGAINWIDWFDFLCIIIHFKSMMMMMMIEKKKRDSSKWIIVLKRLKKKKKIYKRKIKDIKKGGEKKKRYACKEIVIFCLKVYNKNAKKKRLI